jgi:hypothetical protein
MFGVVLHCFVLLPRHTCIWRFDDIYMGSFCSIVGEKMEEQAEKKSTVEPCTTEYGDNISMQHFKRDVPSTSPHQRQVVFVTVSKTNDEDMITSHARSTLSGSTLYHIPPHSMLDWF